MRFTELTDKLQFIVQIYDKICFFHVVTANAITEMRERYLEKGFDEYLSKPIDREKLDEILNQFLK